ncbi:MAG: hypothetical protein IIZ41_03130 [Lachnospiraceae bacterium]|nr:hypothetical protein [Lachnospiraceae bacterium]
MKIKYLIRGIGIGVLAAGIIGFIVGMTGGLVTDSQAIEKAKALGYMSEEEFMEKYLTSEPVKLTDQTPGNAEDTSEKIISEEIVPAGMKTSEETSEAVSEEVKSEEAKSEETKSETAQSEEDKKAEEEAKKKAEEEEKKKAEEEAKKKAEEEEAKKKAEEEAKKKAEEEEAKKKAEEEARKKAEEEEKKKSEEGNKRDSEANGKKVTITIQSGQYSESVSAACEQAGLVKSATEFNKYLCDNGYSNKLRVGDHEIAMGASYDEIAKALCGG